SDLGNVAKHTRFAQQGRAAACRGRPVGRPDRKESTGGMKTTLHKPEILNWLREENPTRLEELWRLADATRRWHVGDAVHLRGLIEISNHCVRQCAYCGLRAGNGALTRYRMETEEILAAARQAVKFGYGTVVL